MPASVSSEICESSMNLIVFDLEWNQALDKSREVSDLPFEIIEIGAARLDDDGGIRDTFDCLVRPVVYRTLHYHIRGMLSYTMQDLERKGVPFADALDRFLDWCGEEPVFATWGSMDLYELQRNIRYFGRKQPFGRPLLYYDVQKLFALLTTGKKGQMSLAQAVRQMELPQEKEFHRAVCDAEYTAQLLARLDRGAWEKLVSVDYFCPPQTKEEEIYLVFDGYSKLVSQLYPDRETAMEDKNINSCTCYRCGREAGQRLHWFPEGNHFLSLFFCPQDGYLKGKIRVKHDGDQVYIIKTVKLTGPGEAGNIGRKYRYYRERRRIHPGAP